MICLEEPLPGQRLLQNEGCRRPGALNMEKASNRRYRQKGSRLYDRVLLSFVCVSIVPVLFFGGYVLVFTQRTAKDNISRRLKNDVERSAAAFEEMMDYYCEAIDSFSRDKTLTDVLMSETPSVEQEQQLYREIYRMSWGSGPVPIVCLTDAKKGVVAASGVPVSSLRDWSAKHADIFAAGADDGSETVCLPCQYSPANGQEVAMSLMRRIDVQGQTLGYLFIDMPENALKAALTADGELQTDGGAATSYLIYTWYNYVVYNDYFTRYSHGQRMLDLDFRDTFKTGSPTVVSFQNEDKITLQMAGMECWSGKFVMVGLVPTDLIVKNNSYILSGAAVFCLLAVLLCSVLAAWFTGTFTGPVHSMVGMMRRVEDGDLQARIAVDRRDELGALAVQLNKTVERMDELLRNNAEEQKRLFQAELSNLQSQIRPHFLYNALDSIKWLAKLGETEKIAAVTTQLSEILRRGIRPNNETETIEESLALVENYLSVWKAIYADKLFTSVEVDRELLGIRIPTFLIQPVVENAVIHGIEPKVGPGHLRLHIYRKGEVAAVNVWDDGVGIPENKMNALFSEESKSDLGESNAHGFGLYSVNRRIQLHYGAKYRLQIESVVNKYTSVTLTFPVEGQECAKC